MKTMTLATALLCAAVSFAQQSHSPDIAAGIALEQWNDSLSFAGAVALEQRSHSLGLAGGAALEQQKRSLGLAAGAALGTRTARTMSLKEAIEYGRQNSPTLTMAGNDRERAKAVAVETRSGLLPQINASGQLDDNLKRQTTYLPAGAFGENPVAVQLGTQYATTLAVQSEQVIVDMAQRYAVQANVPNIEIARLREQQTEEQLVYDAAKAYAQALIHQEQIRLLAENQRQYDELVPILRLRLEKGVAQPLDVDRVEVTRRNIISQRMVAEANYELAIDQLKRTIGMPLTDELQLADSITLASGLRQPSADPFELHALSSYKVSEQSILLRDIELKRKRSMRLPTLSSYARLGTMAQGSDFGDHFTTWSSYQSIGLKMSVPLFSGFRRTSQITQAEIDLANAREQMKLNELGWELDYVNAGTRMVASRSTVTNDEENLHLAEQVFGNTDLQYQQGLAPLSDLLNADYQLQAARNNYTTSLLNHYIATIDMERAKGTLLEFAQTL